MPEIINYRKTNQWIFVLQQLRQAWAKYSWRTLPDQIKVYYLGEFGYFNFSILGALSALFALAPKLKVQLCSYPDYVNLAVKLFPNNVIPISMPEQPAEKRDCGRIYQRNDYLLDLKLDMESEGYVSLEKVLKVDVKRGYYNVRSIVWEIKNKIEVVDESPSNISILCRKRAVDPARNMSEEEWVAVINQIRTVPSLEKLPIIFHGLNEETLKIYNIKNSSQSADLSSSISHLNHARLFISSMSGYAQFASNCGCDVLQIGNPKWMIQYSPFKKKLLCLPKTEIHNLREFLNKAYELGPSAQI